MRASFAIIAAIAAPALAQSYGPISQISDGQIQNPTPVYTPPSGPYGTSAPYMPPANTTVVYGTGSSYVYPTSAGPYANSTTISTAVATTEAASGTSAAASTTSAVATGAASAQKIGSFGFAAALAAVFLA